MTIASAAIALPAIACLVLLARASGRRTAWIEELPIALPLGLGLSSVIWWLLIAVSGSLGTRLTVIDVAFWTAGILLALVFSRRATAARDLQRPAVPRMLTWISVVGCLCALAFAATNFAAFSHITPHGTWDAWAIWNLRARFLFLGQPVIWQDAFSRDLAYSHPDYPLLLPLSVSRAWAFAGTDATLVPVVLAAVFAGATAALVGVSLARARTPAQGFLAATAVLASPVFLKWAPSQIADVPLGLYMLITFVMMWRATTSDAGRFWWVLAGVSASLAAWTKNEGAVFLALFMLVSIVWLLRKSGRAASKDIASLAAGAGVGVAALLALKLRFPAPNDLANALDLASATARVADLDRVQFVLESVGRELWLGGGAYVGVLPLLVAYAVVAGVRRPEGAPAVALLVVLLQIAAYTIVYVVTPHDLRWHLNTSLDRVMLQIFPSAVWGIMMLTR